MSAYYNEHDKFNVEWLKHLMAANLIAPGEIDGRDIQDVRAEDLRGFTQCHFFAGIGVWSYALRCAGWPDSQRVWTGSCPCQPFSVSGKRGGASDERHLWPEFFRLIEIEKPLTIFGEQVASDDGLAWLDLVSSDLEGQGYAVGAVDTPACGFGAPHRRQRLYWLADTERDGRRTDFARRGSERREAYGWTGETGILADSSGRRREQCNPSVGMLQLADENRDMGHAADSRCTRPEVGRIASGDESEGPRSSESERAEQVGIVGKSNSMQPEQFARTRPRSGDTETKWSCCEFAGSGTPGGMDNAAAERSENRQRVFGEHDGQEPNHGRILNGFWESAEWLWCRDEKYRPVEPGTFPLAHGIANRVGKLRGYGNALVAPQAEGFIRAYMEILHA